MKLKALIFDVDGTIANTERDGHLPACNDAFSQSGYPIQWDWQTYRDRFLPLPGTPARVRKALAELAVHRDAADLDQAVKLVTQRKRENYLQRYVTAVSLRAGVRELIAAAVAQEVRLAIVTLSAEEQVTAMLQRQLPAFQENFHPLLGFHAGAKNAPGSPLHRRCLAELGCTADEVVMIEDSESGAAAAVAAGLPVMVTYNDYTKNGCFPGVRLITPTLATYSPAQISYLCLEAAVA